MNTGDERDTDALWDEWEDTKRRVSERCECFPHGGPGFCPGRSNCPYSSVDEEAEAA